MKKLGVVAIIVVVAFIGFFVWWQNGSIAVDPFDKTPRIFEITKGEGVREIANNLKVQGLIKDPVVFFLIVKQQGLDGKIQAGEFHLSPSMNATEIAKALLVGTYDIRITIPEGKRAEEIADTLEQDFSTYNETWRPQLIANEGYLFPDTYSFPKEANIDLILSTMKNNFEKKYDGISPGANSFLPQAEIVTIASLVEREAKYDDDRPLVASVILNRLNAGMALQIDATVEYALGYQKDEKNWWKRDLTANDIKLSSPYNTYENAGLPPTPISNPGVDAISAVINAPQTNYLYYISDKTGHNHYAKTLAEHNANIIKYGL